MFHSWANFIFYGFILAWAYLYYRQDMPGEIGFWMVIGFGVIIALFALSAARYVLQKKHWLEERGLLTLDNTVDILLVTVIFPAPFLWFVQRSVPDKIFFLILWLWLIPLAVITRLRYPRLVDIFFETLHGHRIPKEISGLPLLLLPLLAWAAFSFGLSTGAGMFLGGLLLVWLLGWPIKIGWDLAAPPPNPSEGAQLTDRDQLRKSGLSRDS